MKFCIALITIMVALAAPTWADDTRLPYDAIRLHTGYTIYGKATPHPRLENRTLVTFSNGGHMVLKNSEIKQVLPNSSSNDQFERRGTPEG